MSYGTGGMVLGFAFEHDSGTEDPEEVLPIPVAACNGVDGVDDEPAGLVVELLDWPSLVCEQWVEKYNVFRGRRAPYR